MHQAGVENVVASSGTSLTTEQIRLLSRFTRNITVIYDGDSAGIKASLRGIDMILKEGMNVRVVLLPDGEDPDTFARSRSSEELRKYISDHEQDFLDFKAQLLMEEAKGDPIRKGALIKDMVQSIAQIPDAIQRSVYIKACAATMDIDEQVLIGEVARMRLASTGDRETDEFVRRQTTLRRQEEEQQQAAMQPEVEFTTKIEAGSSTQALERELVKYLLKFGHCSFEVKEGMEYVSCNVASMILNEMAVDDLHFSDPRFDQILATYRSYWNADEPNRPVEATHFFTHHDPAVCEVSINLLMEDDNYTLSKIWQRKEVHVESDEDLLYYLAHLGEVLPLRSYSLVATGDESRKLRKLVKKYFK
jgi:DNA primase